MNSTIQPFRKELKEKFLRDFTPSERIYFLKKAKEAITLKGYQAGEDLFYYCYFLTLKERLNAISPHKDDGYLRIFLVEAKKEVEEEIKIYEERLEMNKLSTPDVRGKKFIAFFSE